MTFPVRPATDPTPTKEEVITYAVQTVVFSVAQTIVLAKSVQRLAARSHRVFGTPELPPVSFRDAYLLAAAARSIVFSFRSIRESGVPTAEQVAAKRAAAAKAEQDIADAAASAPRVPRKRAAGSTLRPAPFSDN